MRAELGLSPNIINFDKHSCLADEPDAPQKRFSGFWLEEQSSSRRLRPAQTETMRRTSCRDHAEHTGIHSDIPKSPASRCGRSVPSILDPESGDPGYASPARF
jgi:hypothetical protein